MDKRVKRQSDLRVGNESSADQRRRSLVCPDEIAPHVEFCFNHIKDLAYLVAEYAVWCYHTWTTILPSSTTRGGHGQIIALSPDGKQRVVLEDDFHDWRLQVSGVQILYHGPCHCGIPSAMFNSDGTFIAVKVFCTSQEDNRVYIWSTVRHRIEYSLPLGALVEATICWSPDSPSKLFAVNTLMQLQSFVVHTDSSPPHPRSTVLGLIKEIIPSGFGHINAIGAVHGRYNRRIYFNVAHRNNGCHVHVVDTYTWKHLRSWRCSRFSRLRLGEGGADWQTIYLSNTPLYPRPEGHIDTDLDTSYTDTVIDDFTLPNGLGLGLYSPFPPSRPFPPVPSILSADGLTAVRSSFE